MQPHPVPVGTGWIEVVAGCMYSGKTEELMRRLRRAQYARQPVVVFKPQIDRRYATDSVGSHAGGRMRSFSVSRAADIPSLVGPALVVGIDEAQFLDDELPSVCDALAATGRRVVVAGLDLDYLGHPFGPMPAVMALAEYVTKVLAICVVCGNPAGRSQRIVSGHGQVLVGATEAYEARCRLHWDPNNPGAAQQRLPFGINLAELPTDSSSA